MMIELTNTDGHRRILINPERCMFTPSANNNNTLVIYGPDDDTDHFTAQEDYDQVRRKIEIGVQAI